VLTSETTVFLARSTPPRPPKSHKRVISVSRGKARTSVVVRKHTVVHAKPKPKPVVKHVVKRDAPRVTHNAIRVSVPTSAVKRYAYDRLGPTQYTCLAHVVSKEDASWDPLKSNYGGSGAYGIPQALPGSKMASAGADWRTNGITQVKWMIGYVNGRYGSACGAWDYWQRHHSY
jgi:hypothetical protein